MRASGNRKAPTEFICLVTIGAFCYVSSLARSGFLPECDSLESFGFLFRFDSLAAHGFLTGADYTLTSNNLGIFFLRYL